MGLISKELVWFVPFVLAGAAGLVAVRFLLPRVWAVARHTLAEALRLKIAVFFIVLMVLGFVAATTTEGDGTVSGRIQSFLVYSTTLVGLLLALLSIFLSRSVSEELVGRQMLVLMTKPLPRWQYLTGKWLGVTLLNTLLLALTGTGIYLTVRVMAAQPPLNEYDAARLEHEVMTARHVVPFELPRDVFRRETDLLFKRNMEEGRYDGIDGFDPRAERDRLYKYVEGRWRNVPFGQYRDFRFSNVLCERDPETFIQVRYKAQANTFPPDEVLRTRWIAGDPSRGTRLQTQDRRDVRGRFHTVPFSADTVAPDGTLNVRVVNVNPFYPEEPQFDYILHFEGLRGVEVFFRVGTFEGNLLRALLIVHCKLMFLTAVALLFVTVFSFPVACLCSVTIYVLAAVRGYLKDALGFLEEGSVVTVFKTVFTGVLKVLYLVIPDFAAYNPTETLADGRNVTLAWLLLAVLYLVIIGTSAAMLIACLLFHRREVSEVSV